MGMAALACVRGERRSPPDEDASVCFELSRICLWCRQMAWHALKRASTASVNPAPTAASCFFQDAGEINVEQPQTAW